MFRGRCSARPLLPVMPGLVVPLTQAPAPSLFCTALLACLSGAGLLGSQPQMERLPLWPFRTLLSVCSPFTASLWQSQLSAEIQLRRSDFSKAILIFSLQREFFSRQSPSLVAPDLPLWAEGLDGASGLFFTYCEDSPASWHWGQWGKLVR